MVLGTQNRTQKPQVTFGMLENLLGHSSGLPPPHPRRCQRDTLSYSLSFVDLSLSLLPPSSLLTTWNDAPEGREELR